jgi:peptide/nickel transport system substrate-binding protein
MMSLPVGLATRSSTTELTNRISASLTEWTVPTAASNPWALTLDKSGKCCWFLEYSGNKLGHLDPSNGTFQEWTIPTQYSNPYDLTIANISNTTILWGTEFGSDKVFLFQPTLGIFQEYRLPNGNTGVGYISAEPAAEVRIWFTETIRNANGEFIYDPATKNVTLYEDQFPATVGGGANGVYADSNSIWFAGFSGLVRWDRATQQYTIWQLPSHNSTVGRSVTLDSYGQVWYTQGASDGKSTDNFVGVLRNNSTFQEWRIQSPGSDPRGISVNPVTQRPWVAEQSPAGNGTIASLDDFAGKLLPSIASTTPSAVVPYVLQPASTQATVSTHTISPTTTIVPSTKRREYTEYALGPMLPRDAIIDSSGSIWISEPAGNKIARLTVSTPDFALITSPNIPLSQGSSTSVTITGLSISNYTGQVMLTSVSAIDGVAVSSGALNIPSGGDSISQVGISISPNVTARTTVLVIQGTDGTIVHTLTFILIITNATSSPTTTTKPQCLIATATYGSDISPEVQLLRTFRDDVLKSKTGWAFLMMFNAWYYSFSPYVAQQISSNWIERIAMKVMLYPLIGSLFLASRVYNVVSADPEAATLLSGLLASSLIGAIYVGLPLGLLARRIRVRLNQKMLSALLLGGISTILLSQLIGATFLLMISTSLTSLAVMSGSATAVIDTITQTHSSQKDIEP